jgi:hypothetical protein
MTFYSNALIMILNDNRYDLYTFDNPRDCEIFSIMNRKLLKVPYDNENNVIVPIDEEMILLILNKIFHNRIYL